MLFPCACRQDALAGLVIEYMRDAAERGLPVAGEERNAEGSLCSLCNKGLAGMRVKEL